MRCGAVVRRWAVVGLTAVLVGGCGESGGLRPELLQGTASAEGAVKDSDSITEGPSKASAEAELAEMSLPPVSTFDRACARCHGPQGSFYGEEFAKLGDDKLHEIAREMMEGPGLLKPTDAEVDAMTAYHRALERKEPFVVVTEFQPGELIRGEASPGARITIASDGARLTGTADAMGSWKIAAPPAAGFAVRAELKGASAELPFPRHQWSHWADAPQ